MKEKFKKEKIRRYMIIIGVICLVSTFVITVGELFGPKKEKVIPGINIVNKDNVEQESFRALYGDRLFKLQNQVENLSDKFDKFLENQIQNPSIPRIEVPPVPGQPQVSVPGQLKQDNITNATEEINKIITYPNQLNQNNQLQIQKQKELEFQKQKEEFLRNLNPEMLQPKPIEKTIIIDKASSAKKEEVEEITEYNRKKAEDTIPAGTFVEGILLSGLDAPTGNAAKAEPHPVLINLKGKAYLPNKWKSDIKECYVLGSGYGDISSERAYIRAEVFSCTKTSGDILERKIDGYVAGEDGKVGLAGTVISKQGSMLARTMVAGFLEGVATAFNESETNYSIGDEGVIKSFDSSEAGGMAAFAGMSRAAERLSEFYMGLVNQMFPVIEINAGRVIDIVFLKQVNLNETEEDYRPNFDIDKFSRKVSSGGK
jgi:conjugal transfer pilus assembly protein TraB